MAWENKGSKTKVALCFPHRGTFEPAFVESIYGPLRYRIVDFCDKLVIPGGSPYGLVVARNALAKQALDMGADYILWADSDMILEQPADANEALQIMLSFNVPIVSGVYMAKQAQGFGYCIWVKAQGESAWAVHGYESVPQWTGNWFNVDVVGLGWCLIRREVFEKVPQPWFHWDTEDEPSEDFHFFEKARKAGYEVKVFSDIKLSHIGKFKIKSDRTVTTLA